MTTAPPDDLAMYRREAIRGLRACRATLNLARQRHGEPQREHERELRLIVTEDPEPEDET